ncbi:hypothetical protein EDD18DRAFT_1335598 [Armillaria luteobubalina]|uniref:Secreted protein n=1 Tax=Armillaria luteobubalina TaxID=153913 RepID=A0AA39PNF3_9AGAR|nr:hypothetical protein EDD18DRAFT_1335598 [Armillaria luteobubalina]
MFVLALAPLFLSAAKAVLYADLDMRDLRNRTLWIFLVRIPAWPSAQMRASTWTTSARYRSPPSIRTSYATALPLGYATSSWGMRVSWSKPRLSSSHGSMA